MLSLPALSFPICSLLLLTSALFTLLSLRGRRTGSHPTCAHCSFDLFNLPATSHNCPECGQDLTRPRSTRIGHRHRSPLLLTLSPLSILISLAAATRLTYCHATDPTLLPHEPTFLLPLHFKYGPLSAQALVLLQTRILTDQSPPSAARPAVAHILRLQADPAKTWNPKYGDFLERLHTANALPQPDWDRYLRQAPTVSARIRPNIRTGDPVPFELTVNYRLGSNGSSALFDATLQFRMAFDTRRPGRFIPLGPHVASTTPASPPVQTWSAAPASSYAALPPGSHTVHLETQVSLTHVSDPPRYEPVPRPPVISDHTLHLPWTLHPSDHPTVRILDDPVLRDAVAKSLVVRTIASPRGDPMLEIAAPTSPCALAYDVTITSPDGRTFGRSPIRIAKGAPGGFIVPIGPPEPSTPVISPRLPDKSLPPAVNLLLTPSTSAATASVDITEICAGAIPLSNVSTKAPTRDWLQH